MNEKEDNQKPKNRVLGIFYVVGLFLVKFLILANIFSLIFGPHILIFVAIIIWELGFVKKIVIEKCKKYLPERVVRAIEIISYCFVYVVESFVWLFYNSLRCAYSFFCLLFWITIIVGGIKFAMDFTSHLAK